MNFSEINESLQRYVGMNESMVSDIKVNYPNMMVVVIPLGGIVTMDYRVDRIRVSVKDEIIRKVMIG